jgi:hypothetical protein
MNSKKCFVLAVTLLTFLIGLNATLWGQEQKDPNDKIKALKEKIAVGKSVSDPNYNDKLKALIKQLESVYDPNYIVYHGKERSRLWFDKMYESFCDKIFYVEGKYFDKKAFVFVASGGNYLQGWTYPNQAPVDRNYLLCKGNYLRGNISYPKGQIVTVEYSLEVVQVLESGELLVRQDREPDALFHLTGMREGQLVDNQSFSFKGYLISLGTFEYKTVLGAKRTIPSFKACNFLPLTREQFAEALNYDKSRSGIDIGEYEYELIIVESGTQLKFSENKYIFLENKDDGSVIIKKGDRIIRRLGKGKYYFYIIQKPVPTKGR